MDWNSDDAEKDGLPLDDPVLFASLMAEWERVLGPLDALGNDVKFQWLIPVAGIGEMLDVLRPLPSGLGVAGFEQFLRERFGSPSMLKRVKPESGEADV